VLTQVVGGECTGYSPLYGLNRRRFPNQERRPVAASAAQFNRSVCAMPSNDRWQPEVLCFRARRIHCFRFGDTAMSRDTVTLRGLLAIWLAAGAAFGYPMLLPHRFVQGGVHLWEIEPASAWLSVFGVLLGLACAFACVVSFTGSRGDGVAGFGAAFLTLVFMFVLCQKIQTQIRRSPNPPQNRTAASEANVDSVGPLRRCRLVSRSVLFALLSIGSSAVCLHHE